MQENATNGLRLLRGGIKGLAEVQASCRFYNNPNVTSEEVPYKKMWVNHHLNLSKFNIN